MKADAVIGRFVVGIVAFVVLDNGAYAFGFSSKKEAAPPVANATVDQDPDFVKAASLIRQQRYADSIPLLEQAIATNPTNADAFNELGHSLRKIGRMEEALDAYQKALALNPKHINATEYLGELYLQMKKPDLAKQQLTALEGLCPSGCEQLSDLKSQVAAYRD